MFWRTRWLGLALLGLVSFRAPAQPVPTPGGAELKPTSEKGPAANWEVKYSDNSSMKIALLDDRLPLKTDYGSITIPAKEIRKIEFGIRLTSEEQKLFAEVVAAIANKDAKIREPGKMQLKAMGVRIAPFLKTALRKTDADSRPHLEQIYEAVAGDRATRDQGPKDYDVVMTDDSQFAGRLEVTQLKIHTYQFGELKLKIADVKGLQFGGWSGAIDDKIEIVEAANFYQLFQTHMNKVVGIKVTGAANGSLWGTGTYTADSNLAAAAVHAGALKTGETKVVRIRIIPDPGQYNGTTANGLMSHNYGRYPTGAYEVIVK